MCADLLSHEGPVPVQWRKVVANILRKAATGTVVWTRRAITDRESIFPDSFEYEYREAMAAMLDAKSLRGKPEPDMVPKGKAYAFFFKFRNKRMYAKINLINNGRVTIIISCHLPKRDTL